MNYSVKFIVYLIFLVVTFITILSKRTVLTKADKWIYYLISLVLLQEAIAFFAAEKYQNNFATYHIYSPIELYVICRYFGESVTLLRRRKIGIKVGIAGIVISILNTVFLQPLSSANTYFLLFESCVVIILCLFSLLEVILAQDKNPYVLSGFWLTLCFLFYWSITFVGWGLFTLMVKVYFNAAPVETVLYFSNLVFYSGIAIVFFNYSRLIPSSE